MPVRLANLAVGQQLPQMPRGGDLPRVRPRLMDPPVERGRRALERLQRHRPGDIEEPRHAMGPQQRQPAGGHHRLGAVQQRQTLLRLQYQGLQASLPQGHQRRHTLLAEENLTLANQRQRQVRQRSKVAARPHRPARRDHGMDAMVEHCHQQLGHLRTRAAVALGQHIRAQQQHGPRLGLG